jgi:hypothetical protein
LADELRRRVDCLKYDASYTASKKSAKLRRKRNSTVLLRRLRDREGSKKGSTRWRTWKKKRRMPATSVSWMDAPCLLKKEGSSAARDTFMLRNTSRGGRALRTLLEFSGA